MELTWPFWLTAVLAVLIVTVVLLLLRRDRPTRPAPAEPPPREPVDLITDRQVRHVDVAEHFNGLIVQHIITAAMLASRSSGHTPTDIAARICRALFGDTAGVNRADVVHLLDGIQDRDTRAAILSDQAVAIRHQATALGGHQEWDFTYTSGEPFDEHRHSPWLDSDPILPVIAVITPAYLLDQHILCRQRVTTGFPPDTI